MHPYCVPIPALPRCMVNYVSAETREGRIVDCPCLELGCPGTVPPHLMEDLLRGTPALLELYQRLSFQKGLEAMGDIVYVEECGVRGWGV